MYQVKLTLLLVPLFFVGAHEGARYDDLIDFLRSNGAKWYEMERGVADKVRGIVFASLF